MRRALIVSAMLMVLPLASRADDKPTPVSLTPQQMSVIMHAYVDGERLASVPFGVAGVSTVVAGGLLLDRPTPLERGVGWPLLAVGAAQVVAGLVLAIRTGGHEDHLQHLLDTDPVKYATEERAHIDRIRHLFQPVLLGVEGAIVAAGGGMAIGGAVNRSPTLEGVGIGLAVQGLVMFVLDWAVLDRADGYAAGLAQFHPGGG